MKRSTNETVKKKGLGCGIIIFIMFVIFLLIVISNRETTTRPTSYSTKSSSPKTTQYKSKRTWKDLTMSQRKDIYLRVTDVPSGPEADRIVKDIARKYNISEGDVSVILMKGTFEWGWGDLP
jgi:hypothetical protein